VRHPEDGVADRPAHQAHRRIVGQREPSQGGIAGDPPGDACTIGVVGYDRFSETLRSVTPVALPGFVDAIGRWQDLDVGTLQSELDRVNARFRAWVEDPANAGRPTSESPDYLDRMAIDTILERRFFWE
jgi:hypothetical protein